MFIRARAPLRLGLAGGGTDVSPFCDLHGGFVLNATIDRYAYAIIKELDKAQIHFTASDQEVSFVSELQFPLPLDGCLDLHKAAYNLIVREFCNDSPFPLEITTFCDAPPGSGLGSSSTLVVAIVQAFVELLNLPLGDYDIARLAFRIERLDCGFKGGRQDQYSASFGGFNFMEFYANDRSLINPLRIKHDIICELEASLILFFTGVSRDSSKIISDQTNNVSSGDPLALNAMNNLKQDALSMKESLLKGDFDGIINSMQKGWKNKKLSSSSVSNPLIEKVYNAAVLAGAAAGKVSGAGGGGFMMFFVPPNKRMNVIRSLSDFGGQISNCHFSKNGSESWKI